MNKYVRKRKEKVKMNMNGAWILEYGKQGAYDFWMDGEVLVVKEGKPDRLYYDAWCGGDLEGQRYRRFVAVDGVGEWRASDAPACYRNEPKKAQDPPEELYPELKKRAERIKRQFGYS